MILCSEFEKPTLMVEEVQNNIVIKPDTNRVLFI
jgi:hypothetical protein